MKSVLANDPHPAETSKDKETRHASISDAHQNSKDTETRNVSISDAHLARTVKP
jgi:hypothetical protein